MTLSPYYESADSLSTSGQSTFSLHAHSIIKAGDVTYVWYLSQSLQRAQANTKNIFE